MMEILLLSLNDTKNQVHGTPNDRQLPTDGNKNLCHHRVYNTQKTRKDGLTYKKSTSVSSKKKVSCDT